MLAKKKKFIIPIVKVFNLRKFLIFLDNAKPSSNLKLLSAFHFRPRIVCFFYLNKAARISV